MHVMIYHVIGNYRLQAQTVSYRIVSPWRGYRLLAYRELSQIVLIGKYRIVTYRALIVSYRIGSSRAMEGEADIDVINTKCHIHYG